MDINYSDLYKLKQYIETSKLAAQTLQDYTLKTSNQYWATTSRALQWAFDLPDDTTIQNFQYVVNYFEDLYNNLRNPALGYKYMITNLKVKSSRGGYYETAQDDPVFKDITGAQNLYYTQFKDYIYEIMIFDIRIPDVDLW